jgi:hypothetical protein
MSEEARLWEPIEAGSPGRGASRLSWAQSWKSARVQVRSASRCLTSWMYGFAPL